MWLHSLMTVLFRLNLSSSLHFQLTICAASREKVPSTLYKMHTFRSSYTGMRKVLSTPLLSIHTTVVSNESVRGCTGWSGSSLPVVPEDTFWCGVAHIINSHQIWRILPHQQRLRYCGIISWPLPIFYGLWPSCQSLHLALFLINLTYISKLMAL